MGILFALLSSLFLALSNLTLKKSYKEFPPSVAFFFDAIFALIIWVPYALIAGFTFNLFQQVIIFAIISAILSEALYFYALSKGTISISGALVASYPLYTILFSFLINHETLMAIQWIFVLLTIAGTLIVSIPKTIRQSQLRNVVVVAWPIIGAIAIGLSDTISKGIINKTSAEAFVFALAFVQVPVALLYLKIEKQSVAPLIHLSKTIRTYHFAILGSFFNIIGTLFLWLAFGKTLASIASPITGAYPVLLVPLAILFLKEKLAKKDLFGILLVIAGIIGLGIYSR